MIKVTQPERKKLPQELLDQLALYSVSDIIASVVPHPTQAGARQYGPFGNIFIRPLDFPEIGSQNAYLGHAHHYDHVTYLSRGTVNLRAWEIDPRTGEQLSEITEKQFKAPSAILIKKNWAHEFTALEFGTHADCIFALRDFDGSVVEEWNGNMEAVT